MSEEVKAADAAGKEADAKSQEQAEAKRTYSEEEFKRLVSERDKAKERLRLIDEAAKKAEEDKKIAEGRAQELLAEKDSRLKDLEAKAQAYEAQQGKLRESLLGKLTNEADKIAGGAITDLSQLSRYVELREQETSHKPFGDKGTPKDPKAPRLKFDVRGTGSQDVTAIKEALHKSGIG